MSKAELKDCPFCGRSEGNGIDIHCDGKSEWYVACDYCNILLPTDCYITSREIAIEKWNTRNHIVSLDEDQITKVVNEWIYQIGMAHILPENTESIISLAYSKANILARMILKEKYYHGD